MKTTRKTKRTTVPDGAKPLPPPPTPSPAREADGTDTATEQTPAASSQPKVMPDSFCDRILALKSVYDLQAKALRGNAGAMLLLVDLARETTRAVHEIFSENPPQPPASREPPQFVFPGGSCAPPAQITRVESLAALHHYVGTSNPFPTLHYFRESGRGEDKTQAEILHALQHGPFKGTHQNTLAAFFWKEAHQAIEDIGRGFEVPKEGWKKAAYELPNLSRDTKSEWVAVAAEYIAERWAHMLNNPASHVHRFALIEHQNAQRKAIKALKERWAAEEEKLAGLDSKGGKGQGKGGLPIRDGGYIPDEEWDAAISAITLTPESLKQGLRNRLSLFLRNLAPNTGGGKSFRGPQSDRDDA